MGRKTRVIKVGNLEIGGNNPIIIQSMTNTNSADVEATARQINELEKAGCQLVRMTINNIKAAEAIKEIKKRVNLPLVADIHFDYRLALLAIENGIDKLRINPGNIGSDENVKKVVEAAKEKNIPIRIGVNSGSIEKEILENTSYLIDMLEQAFHFNIPKYEQEYIDIHISAIEKNAMNHNLSETTLPNLDLGEQLKQLVLDELNEFHADAELINNLVLHLNAAVKRLRLGVNIHNPYTEKIKSSFKQAFFLSVNLLEKIEEQSFAE